MNKYFASLVFFTQAAFVTQAIVANPFEKLTPKIARNAAEWSQKVVQGLNEEAQLAYLNLFAFSSEDAFIKCAEYIESQPEMLPFYEELGLNIMDVIKIYAEEIQAKIAQKKNLTDKEKEAIWQKLQIKIQELVAHINAVYYQLLYSVMSKRSSNNLKYMFDDKGIIAKANRTQALPKPE